MDIGPAITDGETKGSLPKRIVHQWLSYAPLVVCKSECRTSAHTEFA